MISIVIPVKNAAPYLKECLESIVSQTHTDWEVIAINDHSTDETPTILKEFAQKDKRIIWKENRGNGIISALDHAFELSSGEFISRMDADDKMHPMKIEKMYAAILENENSVITSWVEYFAEGGIGDGYKRYTQWLNQLCVNNSHYNEIYKECVIPSPNWLMSRKILDSLGGFSNLEYPEDYDLAFKLYEHDVHVIGIQDKLHYWRDYSDRTSRTHEHYADNSFLKLKVKYFLKLDHSANKKLILWGAGSKGKSIAKMLIEAGTEFSWVTNNKAKLSAPIYDVQLTSTSDIEVDTASDIILSIASPVDQSEIKEFLEDKPLLSAYWFC